MRNGTITTAGFAPVAAGSRLHDGAGLCAYPWHLGSTGAGNATVQAMRIAESKFRHRWPKEPSP
jgi:hypothetical protein